MISSTKILNANTIRSKTDLTGCVIEIMHAFFIVSLVLFSYLEMIGNTYKKMTNTIRKRIPATGMMLPASFFAYAIFANPFFQHHSH